MTVARTKPGVAFWATVVAVVVLVYPISFGPACWWFARTDVFRHKDATQTIVVNVPRFYWPVGWMARHGPKPIRRFICWYANPGRSRQVIAPTGWSQQSDDWILNEFG